MTNFNFLELNNVSIGYKPDTPVTEVYAPTILKDTLLKIMALRPTWRYKFANVSHNGLIKVHNRVDISDESGNLGMLEAGTSYVNGMRVNTVSISNHRIRDAQERRTYMQTSNVGKAVSIVKKYFGPLSQAEIVEQSTDAAEKGVRSATWTVGRSMSDCQTRISSAAFEFAVNPNNVIYKSFDDYLSRLPNGGKLRQDIDKYKELHTCMATLKTISDQLSDQKSILIVKYDGKYIVKIEDNVHLFDDDTFPHEYRSKLGMLKLVEDGQVVTTVGIRVNESIFVLVEGGTNATP